MKKIINGKEYSAIPVLWKYVVLYIYILYYTGISSHYSSTYVLRCCNSFTTNVCHIEYQSRSVMMMETVSFFDSI